jgi:hypothetical protein
MVISIGAPLSLSSSSVNMHGVKMLIILTCLEKLPYNTIICALKSFGKDIHTLIESVRRRRTTK